ncbi:hypothetical protein JJE66_33090 [Bradyrhizobium diazoefficiens]|uniref:hypothetical protein n=1 Tax=Bradyrhizobium diazoefficiens TaxID=1355477 RepID=UPI00190CE50D|nr:hypothetical protein [Bradyrhizobium diazoefficiens]MBK3666045.1 hypothetical protein [Bradyrhizobium diazoefficiens]
MTKRDLALAVALGVPFVCLMIAGAILQWQRWQIYRRIGNYSIGLTTFFWQLDWPGVNFPGPNILEAQIAVQPTDLQAYIQVVRHRVRQMFRATLLYLGFFVSVLFLDRYVS